MTWTEDRALLGEHPERRSRGQDRNGVGPCPRARPRSFPAPTATAALRDWQRRDKPSRHDAAISLGHDVGALLNSNRQKFQFTLNQDNSQIHTEPQAIPQRGVGTKARVPGNPRGVQEMDNADPKLETSIEPLRHHLRKPTSSSGPELSPHAKFVPTRADTKNSQALLFGSKKPRISVYAELLERYCISSPCRLTLVARSRYDRMHSVVRALDLAFVIQSADCMMQILLTNDDGVFAPGLGALRKELLQLGEVTVVAPAMEQSGVAHSITLLSPLVVKQVEDIDGMILGWMVEGSPADSVKLGICELMPRPPDLIVSGINSGSNVGINVLYSGTVAAAIEGAFFKITSIAVSLELSGHFDFPHAAKSALRVIQRILANQPPNGSLFNVNLPAHSRGEPRGIRVVPMGLGRYGEGLNDVRIRGGVYTTG